MNLITLFDYRKTMNSLNDNPCDVFATPDLASSSNGGNCVKHLFSERPIGNGF